MYLGVRCEKCKTPILFALDRSQGESTYVPPARLVLTCSKVKCRHQADYSGAKIARYERTGPDEGAVRENRKNRNV